MNKSEPIQPIQQQEIVNDATITIETKKISNSEDANSWVDKIDLWESETEINETDLWGTENIENPDFQNEEEYEEIIFQDNFDKEYWSGTEDNYLE